MRHLGIDYGTKKIGLALSDEEGDFAFPLVVVPNDKKTLDTIAHICADKGVTQVVIGRSLNYKREENPLMTRVRAFVSTLTERTGLPVAYEEEVLTTREAAREMGKSAETDASAAAIILRTYLERTRNH